MYNCIYWDEFTVRYFPALNVYCTLYNIDYFKPLNIISTFLRIVKQ